MRNIFGKHERRDQMIDRASFAAMRSKVECVHFALASQIIQDLQVGMRIVKVVDIRGVFVGRPILGLWRFHVEGLAFGLGLVVYRIKTGHLVTFTTQKCLQMTEFYRMHIF